MVYGYEGEIFKEEGRLRTDTEEKRNKIAKLVQKSNNHEDLTVAGVANGKMFILKDSYESGRDHPALALMTDSKVKRLVNSIHPPEEYRETWKQVKKNIKVKERTKVEVPIIWFDYVYWKMIENG